jgi:hypothetical protein
MTHVGPIHSNLQFTIYNVAGTSQRAWLRVRAQRYIYIQLRHKDVLLLRQMSIYQILLKVTTLYPGGI